MIDRDAVPISHRSPYKRIDLSARRRPTKQCITRHEIEDNLEPVPDPAFYDYWVGEDVWKLKP